MRSEEFRGETPPSLPGHAPPLRYWTRNRFRGLTRMSGRARPGNGSRHSAPIPAAIAVVEHEGRVLLVRRRNPPDAGLWGFPGGRIAFGETTEAAAVRELHEETGVRADPKAVLTAVDVIHPADDGHDAVHFILVAVLCEWRAGEPEARDDAMAVGWFTPAEIESGEPATSHRVGEVATMAVRGDTSPRPEH